MKKLKIELRMYLAEKLLSWAFDVAPNNKEGKLLKMHIGSYAQKKVTEYKKSNEI